PGGCVAINVGSGKAARHADVSPVGCDGLRARRSQRPQDVRPRVVDQTSRRAAHDDQRVRDGVANLQRIALALVVGLTLFGTASPPAAYVVSGFSRTLPVRLKADTTYVSYAQQEQRHLYVALPGSDDADPDRSVRILVFDIANAHRFVRRIPVWPAEGGEDTEAVR